MNVRVFGAAGGKSAGIVPERGKSPRPSPNGIKAARKTHRKHARAAYSARAGYGHRRFVIQALDGSVFTYALAVSLAIHGLLLAVRFHGFVPMKMPDRGPPLQVALVNAKSDTRPTKADILAQANLDGGGNTDADRRAKTPLPVPPKDRAANDIAITTQKAEILERRAQALITQLKGAPAAPAMPAPTDAVEKVELPSATELAQKTLEVMHLEAQIAKDLDAYQKRPKRTHIGASAAEYRFARYVEDWRQKVERVGNLNYPEAARQLRLYGNLILTVSIRADGSVEKVVIERTSGHPVLDAAATKIVEMAGPYAAFPPDIRRDTEILDITRTWTFARGDELRSE